MTGPLDGLGKRLNALLQGEALDQILKGSAEEIRDEARTNLRLSGLSPDTVSWLSDSLEVTPGPVGLSYTVRTDQALAWSVEFGSQGRRATPWFGPAVAHILPFLKAKLRTVLMRAAK